MSNDLDSSGRSNWRSGSGAHREPRRHGWQQGGTVQPLTQLRVKNRARQLKFGFLLAVLLALFGFWLYSLLFRAVQTPFVAITATDYTWPLPPNAWAQEDLEGLRDLDGKSLAVIELSPNWSRGGAGERDFRRRLEGLAQQAGRASRILFYVSMHGAVDEDDTPCLVPPGASAVDSSTWIPVSRLLEAIKAQDIPEDVDKLLILDCARVPVNWRLGQLYNDFAAHLEAAVEEAGVPRLSLLNAAGPGQVSWTSQEMRGSVFGHYLRKGLAGDADTDGNRQISLDELYRFVRQHVQAWVRANRSAEQEPLLIADAGTRQHDLVWVTSDRLPARDPVAAEITLDELRTLWRQHDELAVWKPWSVDPVGYHDLQNRLLWLEQMATAGSAYGLKVNELKEALNGRFDGIRQRADAVQNQDLSLLRREVLTETRDPLGDGIEPRSLPLATFFSTIDRAQAEELTSQWQRFRAAPNQAVLKEVLGSSDAAGQRVSGLLESTFLRQLQRQSVVPEGAATSDEAQALAAAFAALLAGEQAAVPADVRTVPWLRDPVAGGDLQRRAAEDALIGGDLQTSLASAALADEGYRLATQRADALAAAFDLRDRGWAEVTYLAEWTLQQPLAGTTTATTDPDAAGARSEQREARLLALIENLHTLGEQLDQQPAQGAFASLKETPLGSTIDAVSEDLQWLRDDLNRQVEGLAKASRNTAEAWQGIRAALATPLIKAEDRFALAERLSTIDTRLQREFAQTQTENDFAADADEAGDTDAAEESTEAAPNATLAMLEAAWEQHPAVRILTPPGPLLSDVSSETAAAGNATPAANAAPSASETAPAELNTTASNATELSAAERYARQGAAVRRRLRTLDDRLRDADLISGAAAKGSGTVAEAVLMLSRRERSVRAAAALGRLQLDEDPIAERFHFDLQGLVLWHAARALQDFRGPAMLGQPPFFLTAARDYLAAVAVDGNPSPTIVREQRKLYDQLDTLHADLASYLTLRAENVLVVRPTDPVTTEVQVTQVAGGSASVISGGSLAVFVRADEQRFRDVQLSPMQDGGDAKLRFPLGGDVQLALAGDRLAEYGPRLDVVAAFRGHEIAAPFLVQAVDGVTVDIQPSTDRTTTVALKGTRRQRKSIMFVLDCSGSMDAQTGVEATDGQLTRRLLVAKNALQGMLEQLSLERDARVGVRLFGHRVGWSTSEPVRVLRQTTYARPIPLDLDPSEDVELILPLGRFDSVTAGQVDELLKTVKPWGQTPFYQALVSAMGDFDRDDPGTEKHIVVITDAVNYQFSPSASGRFAPPRPVRIEDVVTAWSKHQPYLHIVGFGIPEDQAAMAEAAYREIVQRTRGTTETTAAEAQVLLQKLDQLLARATYDLEDASGNPAGVPRLRDGLPNDSPGPAGLGETMEVVPEIAEPRQLRVTCQDAGADLLLRGGESVELLLSDDGRRIESSAYLAGSPRFGKLIDSRLGSETGYQAGVHRPIQESEGVVFSVSIQRDDRRFAERPAEVWIEIAPVSQPGASADSRRSYVFYDTEFQPQVPVPVVRWLAKRWPEDAPAAQVRCWCKRTVTPPDLTVPLEDIAEAPAARQAFDAFPEIQFQLETSNRPSEVGLRVVEWHDEQSAGIGSVKVMLASPPGSDLGPERIVRTFDPQHGVVIHWFALPREVLRNPKGWNVQLTRAAAVKADALELEQPIEVSIAQQQDLLPPLPPLGN
jgi:hypothetical protein